MAETLGTAGHQSAAAVVARAHWLKQVLLVRDQEFAFKRAPRLTQTFGYA